MTTKLRKRVALLAMALLMAAAAPIAAAQLYPSDPPVVRG
jgi:hypothetical protein